MKHRRTVAVAVAGAAICVGTFLALCVRTPGTGSIAGRLSRGVAQSDLNLLLVTLDTTRADRLGAYGSTARATPAFDRIAAEGVLFQRAVTAVPLTLPSHATIFT